MQLHLFIIYTSPVSQQSRLHLICIFIHEGWTLLIHACIAAVKPAARCSNVGRKIKKTGWILLKRHVTEMHYRFYSNSVCVRNDNEQF